MHVAAALALYLPDEQLDALTDQLLGTLRSPSLSSDHAQTYVHTVGAIRWVPLVRLCSQCSRCQAFRHDWRCCCACGLHADLRCYIVSCMPFRCLELADLRAADALHLSGGLSLLHMTWWVQD